MKRSATCLVRFLTGGAIIFEKGNKWIEIRVTGKHRCLRKGNMSAEGLDCEGKNRSLTANSLSTPPVPLFLSSLVPRILEFLHLFGRVIRTMDTLRIYLKALGCFQRKWFRKKSVSLPPFMSKNIQIPWGAWALV